MVAAGMETKFEKIFRYFDRNGDGAVSETDFEKVATSAAGAFGYAQSAPKIRTLRDHYARMWELLSSECDVDQDGKISKNEFQVALSSLGDQERFLNECRQSLVAEFSLADQDSDGTVSKDEFRRLVDSLRPSQVDTEAAFRALDRNNDGRVTQEEYVSAWTDVITTPDPKATGNKAFNNLNN